MTLAAVVPFWLDQPPQQAIEVATSAEALGYDELWLGEMATFDAFALAGAIVRETRSLRLVVGPLAVSVRTPVSLALGIQSVAILGDRPADLALGASNPVIVEGWHGRTWHPVEARLRETVGALRQILAGERADFDGHHLRAHGFRLRETPQPVALAIAAFGPMMLRAAVELGDRVVLNLVTPAQVNRVHADLAGHAEAAGRSQPPPLTVWVPVAVDPDEATLLQLAGQIAVYLQAPGYAEMFRAAGFNEIVDSAAAIGRRELAERIPPELLAAVGAIGNADTVAARLGEFRDAGADVVAVVPTTIDDPGGGEALRLARRPTTMLG